MNFYRITDRDYMVIPILRKIDKERYGIEESYSAALFFVFSL